MAKMNQLTRYSRIINKLSGRRNYIPAEELIDAMGGLSEFGINYTIRTLQRDILSIEQAKKITLKMSETEWRYLKTSYDFLWTLSNEAESAHSGDGKQI